MGFFGFIGFFLERVGGLFWFFCSNTILFYVITIGTFRLQTGCIMETSASALTFDQNSFLFSIFQMVFVSVSFVNGTSEFSNTKTIVKF